MPTLVAVGTVALTLAHALLIVPRLPEPTEPPLPGEIQKTPYTALVNPRNIAGLTLAVFLAAQVLWLVPTTQWPLWVAYVGAGGTLVWVDLLTTYLPRRLHYLVSAELLIGAGFWFTRSPMEAAAASALGAIAAGSLFWLAWRFSGTFGFGDVRLATLVGFVGASAGLNLWVYSLALGTLCGAVFGVVAALGKRGGTGVIYPYGPSLWLGPILAVGVSALVG